MGDESRNGLPSDELLFLPVVLKLPQNTVMGRYSPLAYRAKGLTEAEMHKPSE